MKPTALKPTATDAHANKEVTGPGPCADEGQSQVDSWEAVTRGSPHLTVDQLPTRLASFPLVTAEVANRSIERVPVAARPALTAASGELRGNAASLPVDLGRRAPDPDELERLEQRVEETSASIQRLEGLLDVTRQQHEVASSDLSRAVRRAGRKVEQEVEDDATLAERYPKVLHYVQIRGAEVAEGIERSRRQREAVAKARAEAKAEAMAAVTKPDSDKPAAKG